MGFRGNKTVHDPVVPDKTKGDNVYQTVVIVTLMKSGITAKIGHTQCVPVLPDTFHHSATYCS